MVFIRNSPIKPDPTVTTIGSNRADDLEATLAPATLNGSGGKIRTYDQAINSRPLYH